MRPPSRGADALVRRQAAFVADCLAHLRARWPRPRAALLVGHSMGGVSARLAALDPSFPEGFAAALLTLATPHQAPPWPATARAPEPGPAPRAPVAPSGALLRFVLNAPPARTPPAPLRQAGMWGVYDEVRRGWTGGAAADSRNDALSSIAVASLAGGPRRAAAAPPLPRSPAPCRRSPPRGARPEPDGARNVRPRPGIGTCQTGSARSKARAGGRQGLQLRSGVAEHTASAGCSSAPFLTCLRFTHMQAQ